MTKAELLLFTSMTCPNCPPAKKIVDEFSQERKDVGVRTFMAGSLDSEREFKKYDVRSVPTIIIKGPVHPTNIGLRGVQSKKTLHKYVDMALGVTPVHEEKGFWNKILGK